MGATCLTCHGEGCIGPMDQPQSPLWATAPLCTDCNGSGECDCGLCHSCTTAAENAFSDMCEGEPPISAAERHQMAWRQKQELRR